MDDRTIRYYDDNAEEVFALYESAAGGVREYFRLAFPPGAEILDIGSGSGRDLGILVEEEYQAYGAEPSAGLRALYLARHPEMGARVYPAALPDVSAHIPRKFDGVLCSAVLQHLPAERQFDAAFDIRNLLKPGGRLLLSFPGQRPGIGKNGRDEEGRLYTPLVPEAVELLFERLGLARIGRWDDDDGLGRPIRWTTLLFSLRSDQALRPIDRIEGILNRDKKTATYKLALFRALCDIALTRFAIAAWRPGGVVGIPLDEIVERWIYYYWPLMDNPEGFIPQIRGEKPGSAKPIAFRRDLGRLIDSFALSGGLDAFASALGNDALSPQQRTILDQLRGRLQETILKGPVHFAGRSSHTNRNLFEYDRRTRQVLLGADIWRELCLSGHWIQDALLLRWSELTADISGGTISPSHVIDRLLRIPTFSRNVTEAKSIYRDMAGKQCVWTGEPLDGRYEVDHVLPFSLWRNNDLWNLLPAAAGANRAKADRLPANSLLRRRKGVILDYWDLLHQANPTRFELETGRFTATHDFDLSRVFAVMMEAVEVTALQRGIDRWEP
ncbi:MAG: methyltransferase domain-containing protein [Acidobacteria bacterium]|nr:methyltransferase domain-containing protein [Acidobacteriota bacterium]